MRFDKLIIPTSVFTVSTLPSNFLTNASCCRRFFSFSMIDLSHFARQRSSRLIGFGSNVLIRLLFSSLRLQHGKPIVKRNSSVSRKGKFHLNSLLVEIYMLLNKTGERKKRKDSAKSDFLSIPSSFLFFFHFPLENTKK